MSDAYILIVDDEELARQRVRRFLGELGCTLAVAEAVNGTDAVAKIKQLQPGIVLLDIQMPGLDGFEVLQHFPTRSFEVIFQTAYDEFAIKAFEESACDYLLKPFTVDRLEKSLKRAIGPSTFLEKLVIKRGDKNVVLDINTIECFVSRDHYTCIYCDGQEYISEKSLQWLEENINPKRFLRIHRNSIVAVDQVAAIGNTTDQLVTLSNGMELRVARLKRHTLLSRLTELLPV